MKAWLFVGTSVGLLGCSQASSVVSPPRQSSQCPGMVLPPIHSGLIGLSESLESSTSAFSPSPERVAKSLWAEQYRRFLRLQWDWESTREDGAPFTSRPAHRAAAMCLEDIAASSLGMSFRDEVPDALGGTWGYAFGKSTQAEANRAALDQCEEATAKNKIGNYVCKCHIVGDDGGSVQQPPDDWVPAVRRAQCAVSENKWSRLFGAAKSVSFLEAERAAHSRDWMLDPNVRRDLAQYELSPPAPLRIGYPDHQRDFASLCHDRISYALMRIDHNPAMLARLSGLASGQPFGCYTVTVNTKRDFRNVQSNGPVEWECRYVSRLSLEAPATQLELPARWTSLSLFDQSADVWIESLVQINENGRLLEKRNNSRILAIQNLDGLYLGIEITTPEPDGGCNVSYPFDGLAFDVSRCSNVDEAASAAERGLKAAIGAVLGKHPFEALAGAPKPSIPGTVLYERYSKPSRILGGAYYERSTYQIGLVSSDTADPTTNAYDRASYYGVGNGHVPRFLFATLQHVFTVAKNKAGPYRDVDPAMSESQMDELKRIRKATSAIVPNAVASACDSLRWNMSGGVCRCTQ
jgi:hypothetical protein